jgi:PAS domain S-box-containing protein
MSSAPSLQSSKPKQKTEASGGSHEPEAALRPPENCQPDAQGLENQAFPAKDAQKQSRRKAALSRNVERVTQIGRWELDLVHNKLTWSEEMFSLFGVNPALFSGTYEDFCRLIHPEDRGRVEAASAAARAKAEGNLLSLEYRICRSDGSVRTVYERGKVSFDGHDRPITAAGVVMDVTDLKILEEKYRALFEQSAVGMGTISAEHRFLTTNQRFQEIVGYSDQELSQLSCTEITHPDDRAFELEEEHRLLRGEVQSSSWEKRYIRKDGETVWASVTLSRLSGSGEPVLSGIVQDITERKQDELELARTRRALHMLSRCNEVLIRAESESELLQKICKVAVEVGGYRMASVLYALEDEQKSIVPVGSAGYDEGYLAAIKMTWSEDKPEGMGPAGRTIRSGQSVVIPDLTTDSSYMPWAEDATARGYKSVVALPLKGEGRTFGVFGLYSGEKRAISTEEVQLLHELADDLAFGIMNLRARQERARLLDAITAVTEGVADSTGQPFFEKLILHLVKALGASAGCIAGLSAKNEPVVHPICAVVDGELKPDFAYLVRGTPCNDLHCDEPLVVERDVCRRYPDAAALAVLGAEAYAGTQIVDSAGTQIGTIFVLFSHPLKQVELTTRTLKLFASRAAAEMVREKNDSMLREQALLLNKAQDAIIVRTPDHRILYWNQGAERLYGWPAAEVIGRTAMELKVEEPQRFLAAMDELTEKGEWTGELTERTRDGHLRTIECHWTLVKDQDGTPQSVLAINTDVTERKRSEAQLRLLETSVARLNDIVLITEADPINEPGPRIVFVNDAFERLTGYSRKEVLGRSPRFLQGPDTSREELNRVRTAMEMRQPIRVELINYKKNGEPFWIEMDIVPLVNEQRILSHFVAVQRDITDRKKAEMLLQESDARLAHAQKLESIGQLTGGIAHDFNNLLTVILGNAEMLADDMKDDPGLYPLVTMIRTAGQRGAELTSRLLAFARRQALEPKSVHAGEVIDGMLPLLQRALGENIQIEALLGDDAWYVFIDPGQLETAILNLCINARDAMPGGGHLLIETSDVFLDQGYAETNPDVIPGEYVLVAITDTGIGIAPDALGHVFEPFYTTKAKGKGTGLGLSMVYGFTKQSGGHVKIYSELDAGTVVKLYLPRAEASREFAEEKHEENPELRGSETVLLVEDDELVRTYAERLLTELGYTVLTAENGHAAIKIAESGTAFDLLFTDVMMPGGMNGPQLAAEIEKRQPGKPVLFTSGYTENAIVHQGRVDTGANLLHKPYTRRGLAEKLRLTLQRANPGGGR